MRTFIACCTIVALASACSSPPADSAPASASATPPTADVAARDAAAHKAHENYVRVINSNNLDSLMSMMTDDVVFLSAGAKPIVGKA
ncbi:MAG: nuclear transport factor 2 family protein, partial [Gemmatimonadaceae bacterium]